MSETKDSVTVDRLRDGEFDQATDVLARAFADGEPLIGYMYEGRSRSEIVDHVRPLFNVMLRTYLPYGHIHTARLEGELVGVGIRVPPRAYPFRGWDQVRLLIRMLPIMLRLLPRRRTRTMFKVVSAFEREHPHEPHYYLNFVGVDPKARRRGVAAALAAEVIGLADSEGVGCYLETFGPQTKALYERRGFVVRKQFRPREDAPQGWLLWRSPT